MATIIIDYSPVALILGDNIFYGDGLSEPCRAVVARKIGTSVFAYQVDGLQCYGVVSFDKATQWALTIEEKPVEPRSN